MARRGAKSSPSRRSFLGASREPKRALVTLARGGVGSSPGVSRHSEEVVSPLRIGIGKPLQAEGWPLFMALGEAVTGEPYEQFLQAIVDETERARERAEARRDHLRTLEERAVGLLAALDRETPRQRI